MKPYFTQLTNKNSRILIPGGGNYHEAEYLHKNGFTNVYVVDLSKTALTNIEKRVPTFPDDHLIHANYFDIEIVFDIIIEQTFFCAIDPKSRQLYADKASELLTVAGKIVGLLFKVPLYEDHPPFGGSKEE